MSQNRRKFIRIDAGNAPCHVTIGQARSEATMVNESIYGLCIGGLDIMFLSANQLMVVEYESDRIVGRAKSASRDSDGRFQIGILKSDDEPDRDITQILINSFMDFVGFKVVCIPIGLKPDGKILIRLIDGKEFSVEKSKIMQMTRYEREAELSEDLTMLGRLLKLYSVMNPSMNWNSEQDILDQEFGIATPEMTLAHR